MKKLMMTYKYLIIYTLVIVISVIALAVLIFFSHMIFGSYAFKVIIPIAIIGFIMIAWLHHKSKSVKISASQGQAASGKERAVGLSLTAAETDPSNLRRTETSCAPDQHISPRNQHQTMSAIAICLLSIISACTIVLLAIGGIFMLIFYSFNQGLAQGILIGGLCIFGSISCINCTIKSLYFKHQHKDRLSLKYGLIPLAIFCCLILCFPLLNHL